MRAFHYIHPNISTSRTESSLISKSVFAADPGTPASNTLELDFCTPWVDLSCILAAVSR